MKTDQDSVSEQGALPIAERPIFQNGPSTDLSSLSEVEIASTHQVEVTVDPDRFFDFGYKPVLRRLIRRIVEREGPITLHGLARSVAQEHGWQRTGRRIQERVQKALWPMECHSEFETVFVWTPGSHSNRVPFRGLNGRSIREVSRTEISSVIDAYAHDGERRTQPREPIDPEESPDRLADASALIAGRRRTFSCPCRHRIDNEESSSYDAALMSLADLCESLRNCRECRLASGRTQVVFGSGNPDASIMFVGEAPGFHEDKQGVPFVGAAGKLLTELLESVGLSRSQIYIANVIKCRPPQNRDPEPDEVETCKPFLFQQIQLIKPHLVCSMGNFATQTLLGRKVGITKVHGQPFQLKDFRLFPLFHPAAALHNDRLRPQLQEDFQKLKRLLDEMAAPPQEPAVQTSAKPVQMDLF